MNVLNYCSMKANGTHINFSDNSTAVAALSVLIRSVVSVRRRGLLAA